MNNNTLGIIIVRNHSGFTGLFKHNSNPILENSVEDIRQLLESVNNLEENNVALMISSLDEGFIITMATWISGLRGDECISAWIFIPNHIKISGKEIVSVIDVTKKELLATQRNDAKLLEAFSYTYEVAPAKRYTSRYQGDKIAFRYYGQGTLYSLSDLLNDMYQSYYKNYKRIFLLDNSTNLRCLSGDNLSDQKVYSMVVVKSPGKVDSFEPFIGEQRFEGQMYGVEGEIIKIEWRRNGYLPIQTETTVRQDMRYSVPTPNQYIRVIPFDTIKVVDEWGQSIREYEVNVEKKLIEHGRPIAISESKINNVWIEVYAEGFEPISGNVNFTKPVVKIQLQKETYAYEFMLPLKNDEDYYPIKISGNRKLKNSPVKGYVTEGGYVTRNDKNYLRFKPLSRKFWITCLICSIIVLLLGVCGGYALNDFIGGKADQEVSKLTKENADLKSRIKELEKRNYTYTPKGATDNNETYSIEAAISYLDSNNKWNRTEMEKFDDLKGLWDALNERLFDDIIKYETKLSKSTTFTEVVQAVKANKHKKFAQPYTKDNDIRIHPEQGVSNGYINALNVVQANANSKKAATKPNKPEVKEDKKPKEQNAW